MKALVCFSVAAIGVLLTTNTFAYELNGVDAKNLYYYISEAGKQGPETSNTTCMPGNCMTSITDVRCVHSQTMQIGGEIYYCLYGLQMAGSYKSTTGLAAYKMYNKLTELSKTNVHHGRIDFARIGCSTSDINLTEHYMCTIEE